MKKMSSTIAAIALVGMMSTACVSTMSMGNQGAKTAATGAAGGASSQGANSQLETCNETIGTVAIADYAAGSNAVQGAYVITTGPHVQNSAAIVKLLAQQSGCFIVVDRGHAMDIAASDRALRDSGELRGTSNYGKGQVVAADYTITPTLTTSNNDAGGVGGIVGGLFGSVGSIIGGGMQSKTANALLTLVDNRSSVQVSVAEGSAKNFDFGGFGGLFGSSMGGALGGYTNTSEGKVIVAAYMDAFNNIVKATKNYSAQAQRGGLGSGGSLKVN